VGPRARRGPGQARTAPVAPDAVTASVADRAVDEVGETRRALPPAALFAIAGAVVAVDQLTKVWAVAALSDGPVDVGGPLSFRLHRNSGSAFSLFAGATPVLAVLAVVLTVVLVRLGSRATDRATAVGLALVLGGALGNLIDRLARDPGFLEGAVVDFIRLEHWPTFNGADSAITIGVAVVLLRGVLGSSGAAAPGGAVADSDSDSDSAGSDAHGDTRGEPDGVIGPADASGGDADASR
jgi:signal peptidase II